MAATNPDDAGLDHPTVVPANYVPDADTGPDADAGSDADAESEGDTTATMDAEPETNADHAPRCPACGRALADH